MSADVTVPAQPRRRHADRRVAFLNARLLDPSSGRDETGSVLVEEGRIAAIGPGLFPPGLFGDAVPADVDAIDCRGTCLAPGLVDMRVRLGEPGTEHKETFETGSAAAAAGGVTDLCLLPDTDPVIDDVALVEFVNRRAREVRRVRVYPYAAATRGCRGEQITEMGMLAEAGAIAVTDGRRAIANPVVLRRAMAYARTFGVLLVQHPEEPHLARSGVMNEGELSARLGLPGVPLCAETMMLERDLHLVRLTGARYHAAHVSTAMGVETIRRAKREGLPVTCDTAPHYFTLNELAVGDYRSFAKLSPPLRPEADRQAIVAGLVDGTIDVIASDHDPQDQDAKRLPFEQADAGVVGLETLLTLVLKLVHDGAMPLLDALERVTSAPAGLAGLETGSLTVGRPANLVQFDLNRAWKITEAGLVGKSKNTPFDGLPVQGRVVRTMVDGRFVHGPAPAEASHA